MPLLKRFEKAYIAEALKKHKGKVGESAEKTGINPRTMWRKMKEYDLDRLKYKDDEEM